MIKLYPLDIEDVELINKLFSNEEIHYQAIVGYSLPESKTNSKNRLEDWITTDKNKEKHYKIIFNDEEIGIAQIFNVNYINSKCYLAILLDNNHQGKSLGKEILRELVTICFQHMNLNKIEIQIIEYNEKSIRLVENFGFKREGILEKTVFKNGEFRDLYLYGYINPNRK